MDEIIFQVAIIAALIVINGLFSMTEIAVVSARRVRLARAAEDGNSGAATAIRLQDEPKNFLSSVQIGITLVGVLSGAFGGALLAEPLSKLVAQVPALAPYASSIAFAFVIIVITYFSLVIGELVPKNLALSRPESIASVFSRPMLLVSRIAAPLVWLLSSSTTLFLKLLRIPDVADASITEEEIKAHIAHGTELGVLEKVEQQLIESVIRLGDQRVSAIMTSRVKVERIDLDDATEIIKEQLTLTPRSRLPVCRGTLDNLLGFVKAGDILSQLLAGKEFSVEAVIREPVFVPETLTVLELLEVFKGADSSMAMVVDEFGSIAGLVTINDVLEEIVGDLPVSGVVDRSVVVREDGSMIVDGQLAVVDFRDLLGLREMPEDERDAYQTLGGFMLTRMERLPTEGDHFEWSGHRFEVLDMDGRRVDKVLISKVEAEEKLL